MKKLSVLLFGVSSYLIGFSALLGWIVAMLGLLPFRQPIIEYPAGINPLLICIVLTLLFAVQHTIMARQKFKDKITKIIPQAAERPLFVLVTGLLLWVILMLWPANTQIVWSVQNAMLSKALVGLALFGWGYLFLATFAINHFELFGLQQSFNYFFGKGMPNVPFKERLMYKFDRHPIMTGAVIGMWATPTMTMDHLVFSALFTLYIVVGVSIEERDLILQWGDSYLSYKGRVGSIVPTIKMKKKA